MVNKNFSCLTILKTQLTLLIMFVGFLSAFSQNIPIQFEHTEHNFGNIPELLEDVQHQFVFKTQHAVMIQTVEVDCDCTKPTYSPGVISSGKKGFVNIGFQRYAKAGPFEKKVTVVGLDVTDSSTFRVELFIKGNVIPKEKVAPEKYTHKMGRMWVKSPNIMLGDVFTNQPVQREVMLYNSSDTVLSLRIDSIPKFMKVKISSATIPAKSFATLTIQYNGAARKDMGYVVDTLVFKTNDSNMPVKKLIVRATIRQYISAEALSQTASKPKIALSEATHDLGFITKNGTKTGTFEIDNIGESVLMVQTIKSFCKCITITDNHSFKLAPNETKSISYELNTQGYEEGRKISKTIVIYSNDPQHPEEKIIVKALVK